jgi:hypothetical protein
MPNRTAKITSAILWAVAGVTLLLGLGWAALESGIVSDAGVLVRAGVVGSLSGAAVVIVMAWSNNRHRRGEAARARQDR